jgi:hypothetical protein
LELAGITVNRLAVLELAERLAYAGHMDTAALLLIADEFVTDESRSTSKIEKRSSTCWAIHRTPSPNSVTFSCLKTCIALSTAWPSRRGTERN